MMHPQSLSEELLTAITQLLKLTRDSMREWVRANA
jgi:hypothetical protein